MLFEARTSARLVLFVYRIGKNDRPAGWIHVQPVFVGRVNVDLTMFI